MKKIKKSIVTPKWVKIKEMYEAGELQKMLDDKGITYIS